MNYTVKVIDSIPCESIEKCLSLMTPERKQQIDGFLNDKRKKTAIAAEFIAKELAADFLGLSLENTAVLRTAAGKPYIKDNPAYISISHSGDFIAAAVSHKPIGIDIEVIKEKDLRFIKKVFCETDVDFISKQQDSLTAFYKIWTAKEALFKLYGQDYHKVKNTAYTSLSPIHYFENGLIITIIE